MNAKLIEKNERKYLKIELNDVIQKDKQFFIAKIPAKYLINMFTVEPAEYDINKNAALAREFDDDEKYYNYLIKEDKKRIDIKAFQRKEDLDRINEIKKFINNEEYALFPNTIIATCTILNEDYTLKESYFKDNSNASIFEFVNNQYYIYIPYNKDSILVIDGQHRLKGLQKADPKIIENYDVLVSLIINYERDTLAKLFYTINYTQKSVNKSILYHLSGEFSMELDEITFLHETVKILNELDYSPFYKRIKMLGTTPRELSSEDKLKLSVSQAFMIDYLLNLVSDNATSSIHQPVFLSYFKIKEHNIDFIRFIINYFSAIKETCPNWDDPTKSIISKSLAVGALIKTLPFLFIKILFDEFDGKAKKMLNLKDKDIKSKLKGLDNVDFSATGEFSGIAGASSLNKIKKEIIKKLEYFNTKSYEEFIENFKKEYLQRFKKLNEKNIFD